MSLSSEVDVEFNESTMEEYSRLREEISQLQEQNSKLHEENLQLQKKNEGLQKDCDDYEIVLKLTKEASTSEVSLLQAQVDELQSRLTELNAEIAAGHPSRELDDLLRKNADLIFVAEREIRVLHEAQIQLCERSSGAYFQLSSLAKKIVDKMDAVGQPDILSLLSRNESVTSETAPSVNAFEENSYLKHELQLANETIMERDEAIKSLLEGTEMTSPTNELDLQEHLASQEEKIKKYEQEIELLKGVVAKLTTAADDESSINDDYEKIGRLTREMVKIRLGLGHVTPKEAYNTLKSDNALGDLTAKELEAMYDAGAKKRNKNTPIKRLKRIFSTKKKPAYSPIEEYPKEEEVH